jgi:tetratricopeptide (TPR) repeat protein
LGGLAPAQHAFFRLTTAQFCMSAAVLFGQYVLALIYPYPLRFYHVFHPTAGLSVALLLSVGLLALLAWAFLRLGAISRTTFYAVFWVVVALAPVMNIGGVGQNVFAERYLYLPSAGFAILAALAWQWLARLQPKSAWPVAGAVLLAFSIVTIDRNRDWVDDFTLLQVSLTQSPDSAYLHNLMAGAWVHRDQFELALEEQRLAVRYEPDAYLYHQNLGNILLGVDPRAAAAEFLAAISIQPIAAELHSDLAIAYRDMGDISKAQIEIERATELRKTP